MTWFYAQNGEQKGPVSEDELQKLAASGAISTEDLVWKEGMGDWASYGSVFGNATAPSATGGSVACPTCGTNVQPDELIPAGATKVCPNCRDSYAQELKEGVSVPLGSRRGNGTGGQTPNAELRAKARESLSGKWGLGAGASAIWFLIMVVGAFIPFLGSIVQFVISGPLAFGYRNIFLKISRQEDTELGVLFSGFSNFGIAWLVNFVVGLISGLAGFAAAIPGIILVIMGISVMESSGSGEADPLFVIGMFVAFVPGIAVYMFMYLRYSMAMFIAIDDPEVGTMNALNQSVEMMAGKKKKLLMLYLSFIGWYLLGMLAFLVGLLWVFPYIITSISAFYDDLGGSSESDSKSGPGLVD